jgi:hypothetical protein
MLDEILPGKRKRGRPPKPKSSPPKVRQLGHTIAKWCATTDSSRSKAWRWMETGKLKYTQPGGPGSPRIIPTSEYVRHGLIASIDEL